MRRSALVFLALASLPAAACGSSGGGSGTSGGATTGDGSAGGGTATALVAKVEHAKASVSGKTVDASATVTEGGHAGEHLTLRYGVIDAVSGVRASQEERLAAKYTTTSTVKTAAASVKFPVPDVPTDYLVHFALYAPDGSYLASSDSPIFTVR
jgi:hypothetical protein